VPKPKVVSITAANLCIVIFNYYITIHFKTSAPLHTTSRSSTFVFHRRLPRPRPGQQR
jgi:hypothetical protein